MAGPDERTLTALGRALASLGHELNNVVGVVQSYATFVQEGSRDEAVIADALVIRSSAEKGAQLARQLLAFGHPNEDEAEPLELGTFVLHVAGFLRRALGESCAVEVQTGAVPVVAVVRRAELGRVLLALSLELCRAFRPQSALLIRVQLTEEPSGSRAELCLAEQGTELVELVELELDLAWVRRAVEAQGGTVQVKGRRLSLAFPAVAAALDDLSVGRRALSDGPAEARGTETVLVLEAGAELRQALCRMLEAAGYRALEAEDEPTALGLGLEGGVSIDVLLSSSGLAPASHVELCQQLRAAHPRLCGLHQSAPLSGLELQRAVRHVLDERIGRSHAALVDAERVLALVVDDDPHVRLALSRILDDCGADVVTAPSGLHALQKLASLPVDLLIADQAMPGMEGMRLLETAYKSWPRVARVVYTGYLSSGLVIDAVNRANVHKVLAKDMALDSLRQQLSELIAEIRGQRP